MNFKNRQNESGFALMLVALGLVALGLAGVSMLNQAGSSFAFSVFSQNRVVKSLSSQMMASYCAVLGTRFNNEISADGTKPFNTALPTNVLGQGIDAGLWNQSAYIENVQFQAVPVSENTSNSCR